MFKKNRLESAEQIPSSKMVEKSNPIFIALIAFAIALGWTAILARVFLLQPFSSASESMRPTLVVGDYIWVLKDGVFGRKPRRGEVVVSKLPRDNETDYIKRLVGMPGDRIQMIGGRLVLNGAPVQYEKFGVETITDSMQNNISATRYKETTPEGTSYVVCDLYQNGPFDDTEVFVVPAGHYFMMGDNRDNSADSRADPVLQAGVGFVPAANIVGRVISKKTETTK